MSTSTEVMPSVVNRGMGGRENRPTREGTAESAVVPGPAVVGATGVRSTLVVSDLPCVGVLKSVACEHVSLAL
jgi:hypothetical protein